MKTFKSSQQVLVRIFLVLLLALLAFQSLGLNGLAAPAARPRYFQNEGGLTALSCSAPIYRNAQVVLMIDDSGSMIATNDRGFQRNLGATGVVDVLSNKLSTLQSGQQSPDVKIAVLHFSSYIKAGGTIRQLNQDRDNVNSDIDQNKKFPYRLEKTNFVQLFEYAARLWKPGAKPAPMLTADDNAIRLIFLFTDGTPDYGEGPLKGNTLKTNIGEIATQVLKLPPVNTIYYVAYKGSYSHLDDIKTYWDNQKNLHPELPNIEIYTGDSFKNQLEKEVTTAWVEQKIAVKLDNQPIQAEIGKPANIIFQLVDDSSSDNRVISNDVLPPGFKLNGVSVTSGSQVIPVTRDDPNYQFSWTPKTLNDDSVNITASFVDDQGNKFDCAGTLKLQFPDVSTTTFTPTPTGTATSTPGTPITDTPTPTGTIVTKTFTPTPTSTATVTETFTPTPVTITPPLPAPLALSLIVMPPRYCSGDSPTQSIVLPMKLHSEAPNLTIGSQTSDLTWSITAQGMADGNPIGKSYIPEVKPADAKNGEYNLIIAPIPNADEIQVEVGAAVKVGDQSINIPKATGIITAPPSVPCNLPVCAYSGAWKIWFWPLLIGLAGLMIILLVLRFGSRRDEAESQESNRDIFRNRDWHFLFWPLLVLLIMLVLVRVIDDWICVVPPWLFLVSILVWLVFALLIRFFAGRDSSQPRPWWLLLLLLALAFLGYLAINIPALSVLWLLLVLLMAWVILWYLGPDDHITPAGEPTHPPHPPAPVDGFDIQVGPSGDPLEDGSIKVPVQLSFRSSDTAMIAPEWHVHSWNVDVSSPDRELAWTVEPKAQEPDGTEPGSCLVTIHGVGLDRTLIEVTASAELDINHHLVETLKATSTILIVPVNNKTLPEEATRDIIREVPVPVIHEVIKEVEVTREVPIPIITETIKEVVITNQIIVYVPDPTHPDDLTELEGIGTVTAQLLNQKGIFSFQQLAQIDIGILNLWLGEANLKMMDPKTWPQQARLADIAKRYGKEEDRQNYLAYQAWLRDGIEPDEYDKEEKDRRKDALVWNRISECAPLVLSLALGSASAYWEEALRLPLRLNYEADQSWLATVEWKVSAKAMPAGEEVSTIVESVDGAPGQFMLAIGPVQDTNAEEIQVVIQALLNGRSIEIYYGSAVMVQVTAPSAADPLEELEGIGEAVRKLLNANGIHTFEQLAGTDVETLNRWLNEKGYQRMDPKTWPQQAKLADIARKYGRQEDRQSYEAYKAWLVGGIEPDEVDKDEKDRRPVARPWPIAADSMPDPLEDLEGIGKDVAQILNDKGIFTFRQLAKTDVGEIIRWLNECGYERMDPKTWPQQAKLAGIAKEFDTEEDRRSYEAYKAWLKGGIEPDEYHKEEKDRRTVALTWHGTAELTQRAYPEIFG